MASSRETVRNFPDLNWNQGRLYNVFLPGQGIEKAVPDDKSRHSFLVGGNFQVFIWICVLTISSKSSPNYRHIVVEDCVLKNLTLGFAEQERGAESFLPLAK